MSYSLERAIAVSAVETACRLGEAVRAELAPADTMVKADKSPVTVADFGIQSQVSLALRAAIPDVRLVAEEEGEDLWGEERSGIREAVADHVRRVVPGVTEEDALAALSQGGGSEAGGSGRFWTLDPVDGTKGFLRGGQYAIALALIEDGEVVLGVLGCPNFAVDASDPNGPRGCLFVAVKGEGTRMRSLIDGAERAVRVSEIADPARAVFCESVEAAHSSHDQAGRITTLLGVSAPPARMDSQCKYAAVARGDATVYLRLPTRADYVEKIWDHAAGCLVVTEAGGEVSDVHGRPLDFSRGRTLSANRGVIATNGKLHADVQRAVQEVLSRD